MEYPLQQELEQEGRHLYRCLFREQAPSGVIAHYCRAHEHLPALHNTPHEQYRSLRIIVDKQLDATAIEPWMRAQGRRHALSAKLLLLAYLAECSGNQSGLRKQPIPSRTAMSWTVVCGFFCLLHGRYQKIRHGLL